MQKPKFGKLFEPITIGTMEIKNRIVLCPMGSGYCNETGAVNERLINFFVERAKGGVGLIIIEAACVESSLGKFGRYPRLFIDSDRFIAGLYNLVESVRPYNTKMVLQLQHAGSFASIEERDKIPVAPSEVPTAMPGVSARALSVAEIEEIQEAFAEATRRAKVAGLDGVDINYGCGLLPNQFLSPLTNKRTDRYGGDLEGRMRFAIEIIERVQQKVGKDYPIICDLQTNERRNGGITLAECTILVQKLEKLGVAAFRIHSSIVDKEGVEWIIPPHDFPQGFQVHDAEEIKKVLKQTKVMVGRQIQDPTYANSVIEEGKADLIVLGRPLLADPELPKKWVEGKLDEVQKCTYCNLCIRNIKQCLPERCSVNPKLGKESGA